MYPDFSLYGVNNVLHDFDFPELIILHRDIKLVFQVMNDHELIEGINPKVLHDPVFRPGSLSTLRVLADYGKNFTVEFHDLVL